MRPEPISVSTVYPTITTDNDGMPVVVHSKVSDEELEVYPASDFSLRSLLSAGVDPSRMSISTSTSRVNEVLSAKDILNSISPDLND